jgi:phasin
MESVMNASERPQFEFPKEMRAVAEQSVDQAKVAFQQLMQAAEEAVFMLEQGEKRQVGALDISKKAMAFAERNVLSAFELAQKIVYTRDIQDLVRMQAEFLQSQMHTLGEQVNDLSETVSKAATDSKKTLKIANLSS